MRTAKPARPWRRSLKQAARSRQRALDRALLDRLRHGVDPDAIVAWTKSQHALDEWGFD